LSVDTRDCAAAASKADAAKKREDDEEVTADYSYDDDEDDDDDEFYDNDLEEDMSMKQTVCGRDVEVTKLVADIEFMALVDKYSYRPICSCRLLTCIAGLFENCSEMHKDQARPELQLKDRKSGSEAECGVEFVGMGQQVPTH